MQLAASLHPYLVVRDREVEKYAQNKEPLHANLSLLAILQKDYLATSNLDLSKEKLDHKKEADAKTYYIRLGHLRCRRKAVRRQGKALAAKLAANQAAAQAAVRPPLPRLIFTPKEPEQWQKDLKEQVLGGQNPFGYGKNNSKEMDLIEQDPDLTEEDSAYLALSPKERNIQNLQDKLDHLAKIRSESVVEESALPEPELEAETTPSASIEESSQPIEPKKPIAFGGKRSGPTAFFGYANPEELAAAKEEQRQQMHLKTLAAMRASQEWKYNFYG